MGSSLCSYEFGGLLWGLRVRHACARVYFLSHCLSRGCATEVEMSKNQVNAASWVIKKSLNLHARLQGRSKSRRDEDVQELSVARCNFCMQYLTTCVCVCVRLS